jgi:membrane protease YdiL (CAAX protease family)
VAPSWAAFLGLTGALVAVLLVLARLSQQAMERDPSVSVGADPTDSGPGPPSPERSARTSPAGDFDRESASTVPSLEPDRSVPGDGPIDTSAPGESMPPTEPTTAAEPVEDRRRSTDTDTSAHAIGDLSPAALLANVALTHGLFAGVLLVGAWYFEIPARAFGVAGDPWSTGVPAVALGLGFGLALWMANEAGARIADAMGVGYDESLRELLGPDSLGGWVVLLGVVLPLIALGEELVFRAALVGVPAAGFGTSPWALAALSAVTFALGHGAQGTAGVVVTGLLGFVLAVGFVVTGSLLVVVVAHYVVNALEFVVHEGIDADAVATSAPE